MSEVRRGHPPGVGRRAGGCLSQTPDIRPYNGNGPILRATSAVTSSVTMAESPSQPEPVVSLRAGVLLGVLSLVLPVAAAALLRLAVLPLGSREWAWSVRSTPRPWNLASAGALLGAMLAGPAGFRVGARAPPPLAAHLRVAAGGAAAALPADRGRDRPDQPHLPRGGAGDRAQRHRHRLLRGGRQHRAVRDPGGPPEPRARTPRSRIACARIRRGPSSSCGWCAS